MGKGAANANGICALSGSAQALTVSWTYRVLGDLVSIMFDLRLPIAEHS